MNQSETLTIRFPVAICGYCSGRGINDSGSDCQYCDLGEIESPFDQIAQKECGLDLRDCRTDHVFYTRERYSSRE
jgi:hypothetical protein